MTTLLKLTPIFFVLLLASCQQEPVEQDDAYNRLLAKSQAEREASKAKDSTLNEMMRSFNDIYANLKEIREKESGLKVSEPDLELQNGANENIMAELKSIDELMAQNRERIAALRKELKGSDIQMAEMTEAIENLNAMLEERDIEIARLEDELMSTSSTLGTLIQMYRDQSQMVEHQEDELNTAYYIFGTTKDLIAQGVLTKEGGFAGIGKKQKLSGDVDPEAFKKIDITKDTNIVLKAKDPKILSTHPSGSYEWTEGRDALSITDPTKFWSVSKYLVISITQ